MSAIQHHFIRDGRFVCTATIDDPCHIYPACECEHWSEEHDQEHPPVAHDECWQVPWIEASYLRDTYSTNGVSLDDDEFPDGPVDATWEGDCLMWKYADDTDPTTGGGA